MGYQTLINASVARALDSAIAREVQQVTKQWVADYNCYRSNESQGNLPPTTFLPRPNNPVVSTFKLST